MNVNLSRIGGNNLLKKIQGNHLITSLIILHLLLYFLRYTYVPYTGDNDIFQHIGWRVAVGTGLFSEIWDHKGPVIFWVNALGFSISGSGNYGAITLFALNALAILLITYRLCLRIFPDLQAALVAAAISFCALADDGGSSLNSVEWVASLVIAGGLWLHLSYRREEGERWWVLILLGAVVGYGMVVKATIAGFGVYLIAAWMLDFSRSQDFRLLAFRGLLSFAGFATALLLCILPFALTGTLASAYDAAIYYNMFEFRKSADSSYFSNLIGTLYKTKPILTGAVMIAALVYFLSAGTRRNLSGERHLLIPFAAWMVAEILLTSTTDNFYSHYLAPALFPGWILVGLILSKVSFVRGPILFAGVACLAIAMEAAFVAVVHRHIFRIDAEHRKPLIHAEEMGLRGRDVAVCGGAAVSRVLLHVRIFARQKYPANLLYYQLAESEPRRIQIQQDFMTALKRPGVNHILSERPLEKLPWFPTSEEFQSETKNWQLIATVDGIHFYERMAYP
jgi:4-amino-4-deoxy-L-arabinose transferase-like glycosyltransferase